MSETLMPKQSYIAIDGKEYIIYPMKLKDYGKVDRLFSLINDEYLFLNLPFPMVDEKGNPMLNKNGQQMLDFKAYNAMCELFEMALRIPKKEVMNVVDVSNGVVILDEFRNISGLKKKIQNNLMNQATAKDNLTDLSQALYSTLAKLEKQ